MKFNKNTGYLIFELTKREIATKYRGSILGVAWSLLNPMIMLGVFTFIFAGVFQAKWHGGGDTTTFALNLFAGLIVFWFFADALGRAPALIYSQPNFVKKVVFPLEVLPIVSSLSALIHFLINFVILCFATFILKGDLYLTLLLVLVFMCIGVLPLIIGLSLALSSFGVYIRDISSIIGSFLSILMFLSPIFYPLEATPQSISFLMELNPLSYPIDFVRKSVLNGEIPSLYNFIVYEIASLFVLSLGVRLFRSLRGGFADLV